MILNNDLCQRSMASNQFTCIRTTTCIYLLSPQDHEDIRQKIFISFSITHF